MRSFLSNRPGELGARQHGERPEQPRAAIDTADHAEVARAVGPHKAQRAALPLSIQRQRRSAPTTWRFPEILLDEDPQYVRRITRASATPDAASAHM